MSQIIVITSNYRSDLALARATGLSFPKSPKSTALYAAIDAHNAAVTGSSVITTPEATPVVAEGTETTYEETTYSQPEQYDVWVSTETPTTDTPRPVIYNTLDCGEDTSQVVSAPHSPVLVALVIMAVVWVVAKQLVKGIFTLINLAEAKCKSSQPVDYFAGLDDLLNDNTAQEV
jgi:hypothetical protein